jgi:hypothetical protein
MSGRTPGVRLDLLEPLHVDEPHCWNGQRLPFNNRFWETFPITHRKSDQSIQFIQTGVSSGFMRRQGYFSLSATVGAFQGFILVDQPVNARNNPNVADREKSSFGRPNNSRVNAVHSLSFSRERQLVFGIVWIRLNIQ